MSLAVFTIAFLLTFDGELSAFYIFYHESYSTTFLGLSYWLYSISILFSCLLARE